ncbi:hypothetical protein RUM43_002354 [Polyplax serrata]|uniref:Uncharacterized protein n=1 Tax=Polyplax serrata TaxID=468196 RepID=A0AAN8S5Y1_POLSC
MATADKVREVCKHKSASEHKKKKSKLISEKVGHIDDDNDDDLSRLSRETEASESSDGLLLVSCKNKVADV